MFLLKKNTKESLKQKINTRAGAINVVMRFYVM